MLGTTAHTTMAATRSRRRRCRSTLRRVRAARPSRGGVRTSVAETRPGDLSRTGVGAWVLMGNYSTPRTRPAASRTLKVWQTGTRVARWCETAPLWSSTRPSDGAAWSGASHLSHSSRRHWSGSWGRPCALRRPGTPGARPGSCWRANRRPQRTGTTTTDEAWRARNPDRFEGLRRAPVVLLSYGSPDAYTERYGETDKDDAGLAGGDWPVPYWFGDAAFGVMAVLLAAVDAGLGACFLGNFRGEAALASGLQVPSGWRLFGAVLLGRPDGQDRRSRFTRPRRATPLPADPSRPMVTRAPVLREHVFGALLPACHGPQEVRQPVEIGHHERAVSDGLGHGDPLGAAHNRAGQIERGRHPVLTRHGEVTRHVKAGQETVDPHFQSGHHVGRHEAGPRLELAAVLGSRGHFRHEDVELAGERGQAVVDLGVLRRLRGATPMAAWASSTTPFRSIRHESLGTRPP